MSLLKRIFCSFRKDNLDGQHSGETSRASDVNDSQTQSNSIPTLAQKPEASPPRVTEITLRNHYRFMYENFVLAAQYDVYLVLERRDDQISCLHFDSSNMRYGGPNDEARGGHPLAEYGLGFYGLFEVENSPWIREQMIANRVHPSHFDGMFSGRKHYIACFKDVMLEVVCESFEEKQMPIAEFNTLVLQQLNYLSNGG